MIAGRIPWRSQFISLRGNYIKDVLELTPSEIYIQVFCDGRQKPYPVLRTKLGISTCVFLPEVNGSQRMIGSIEKHRFRFVMFKRQTVGNLKAVVQTADGDIGLMKTKKYLSVEE